MIPYQYRKVKQKLQNASIRYGMGSNTAVNGCTGRSRPVGSGISLHTSAQARTCTQKLCDGPEKGQIVITPDERKAEGLVVRASCLCNLVCAEAEGVTWTIDCRRWRCADHA